MNPKDDILLPYGELDPPVPTLEGLAAENVALRARVARLEATLGIVTDDTLCDLSHEAAMSLVGGAVAVLEAARERAGKRRNG